MKRIIIILLVVAVGSYFTYHYFEGKAKEKVEQKERRARSQKLRESLRAEVSKMASKFGAIEDWEEKLNEVRTASSKGKIFTIDLEKIWITNKPILFKGHIKDIQTLGPNTYSIWLDKQFEMHKPSLGMNLALSLECSKDIIDPFLSAHQEVRKSHRSSVAIIAQIIKIENSSRFSKEEDEEIVTRVGIGKCLDLLYRDKAGLERGEY